MTEQIKGDGQAVVATLAFFIGGSMDIFPWKQCFCGSTEFKVRKPGKWWEIICSNCKCQRTIKSPGIAVNDYSISVPFKEKHTGEPIAISGIDVKED